MWPATAAGGLTEPFTVHAAAEMAMVSGAATKVWMVVRDRVFEKQGDGASMPLEDSPSDLFLLAKAATASTARLLQRILPELTDADLVRSLSQPA